MIGNWFAIVALFSWPLVSAALYRALPPTSATVGTVLGALLLLPSEVSLKIPMLPAIDKNSVPGICAMIGCLLLSSRQKPLRARSRIAGLLIFLYILGPIFTSTLNNDAVIVGNRVLPGVGYYDAISAVLSQSIFFSPYLVGRRIFRSATGISVILQALVFAGLLYSVPMLIELRMSPQLSNWIYGYFPQSMDTIFRFGGYRPVVFMDNGLILAFFAATSFLAGIALWRVKMRTWAAPPSIVAGFLGAMLALCKSAGAIVYGVMGGFLLAVTKPSLQFRIAALLVCIGLAYPVLRAVDLFPTNALVSLAQSINADRAQSLQFRFENEDRLLAHASQRFIFGWGRYGRGRVYSEDTGADEAITDGAWIITLGTFGIVGFLAQFGLLAIPVIRAASARTLSDDKNENLLLAALALIVALTVVEQLPNASLSPWSWLIAGALLGRVEFLQSLERKRDRRIPNGFASR